MIKKSKEHLIHINESYFQHMLTALKISFQLCLASLMAFIHALFPFLFTTGAGNKIKQLNSFIDKKNKN